MNLTFAKATKEDLEQCLSMIQDFYSIDQYPFDRNKVQRCFYQLIANEHLGRFWLLRENNNIAGYLILSFGFSFEYGGRDAFIDELYLKKEFRGLGYGKQLLEDLDQKALILGVNAIHLEVEKTNEAGNQLYLKSGFKGNNRSLLTKRISQ